MPGDVPSSDELFLRLHAAGWSNGIAYGNGWIGSAEEGRLVVWGEALERRWALRGGVFVELAEEA
jgi:hypothetical protein